MNVIQNIAESERREVESERREQVALDQARLNIDSRTRTSRLPWRGQFSPELVDYLIEELCPFSNLLLDPFCGSGTVLFEAMAKGKNAIGFEVNPAAWHLAGLTAFSSLSETEKRSLINRVRALGVANDALFRESHDPKDVLREAGSLDQPPIVRRVLAACVLLGMGNGTELTTSSIAKGATSIASLLEEVDNFAGAGDCFLRDARETALLTESIDGIITSPPYINVFNYHQNYRPATEMLGWSPLEAARSEIGSNRKHRMNRFLTVVQYCLDMAEFLGEASRVLKDGAPLVVILGRTSNVLGASFENGALISALLSTSDAFGPVQRAERWFTNRFGEKIFEDIVISRRIKHRCFSVDDARQIGVGALRLAERDVPSRNREALVEATHSAAEVKSSPRLRLSEPAAFVADADGKTRIKWK